MDDETLPPEALLPAMIAAGLNDEPPVIVVCQGPPRCDLVGDEAAATAEAGCVWCRRITVFPDGSEAETGPVEA